MEFIKDFLMAIPCPLWLKVMIASMIPFVESRYAILFFTELAQDIGMPFWELFTISIIGNMVPVPIIILLFRPILELLRKTKLFRRFAEFLMKLTHKKAKQVLKYEVFGLLIFVALPIPGTGAISGAMVAAILDIRLKKALPVILLGAIIATSITTGALGVLTHLFF